MASERSLAAANGSRPVAAQHQEQESAGGQDEAAGGGCAVCLGATAPYLPVAGRNGSRRAESGHGVPILLSEASTPGPNGHRAARYSTRRKILREAPFSG